MSDERWIACGDHYPRLELFGEVEIPDVEPGGEPQSELNSATLKNFGGIRIAVTKENDDPEDRNSFNTLRFYPISFPKPLVLAEDARYIKSLQLNVNEKLIFEGLENPLEKLFDLVTVYGWKLELKRRTKYKLQFRLIMMSDWELDTVPDYFPGRTKGEAVLSGEFGRGVGKEDYLSIGITWPFSLAAKLQLQNPQWSGLRWRATLDASTFNNILDGVGGALREFSFGVINVSAILDKVMDVVVDGLEEIDDFLFIVSGVEQEDLTPYFEIELSTPETTEIASFGGLKLMLVGRAAFAMRLNFKEDVLKLSFLLKLGAEDPDQARLNLDTGILESGLKTGIKLTGPLIRKIQEGLDFGREVAALLPIEGVPELPEIDFIYEFDFLEDFQELSLGELDIPLKWDLPPVSNPSLGFLKDLPLVIPEGALEALKGFKLGGLDGDFPNVALDIKDAKNYNSEGVIGLDLDIQIQFQLLDEVIELKCRWLMIFDLESLAFDPTAAVEIDVLTREINIHGLRITGLDSMEATWESSGLVFTASGLRAFYSKLNEESETSEGFELLVENLKLDSGGVDIEMSVAGGVTKLAGIGEAFKGAEGYILIERSEFKSGYITAEGALPWFDNATGSLTINFVEGFKLGYIGADFQLGFHHKTDWWLELDLKSVGMILMFENDKPKLILMITGKISFVPPEGSGKSILSYLKSGSLEFKDLVLTSAFDSVPAGIDLTVVLSKPAKIPILGAFEFEMRSIGIGSGFERGQASITIGGQIYFSGGDAKNNDPEYHKFRIGNPPDGSIIPRIALEKLPVSLPFKPAINVTGSVKYSETDTWSGFKGDGQLTINNTIHINVIMEFATVLRTSDDKKVRVWMIFAEYENLNIRLLDKIYIRDIGVGFGWRKTLKILDNPGMLLEEPTKKTMAIGPHLPSSWVDDLEGDPARWTVALSAWATYGLGNTDSSKKNKEDRAKAYMPLVADLVIAIRSDMTFIAFMRGWIFAALDKIKKGSIQKPAIIGMLYYSARNRHFIASYVVDPSASTPGGIPPALIQALIQNPFNLLIETRPGLFRLELGWPRGLAFPLGIYTGRAGFLLRTTPHSLTIGVGFEIGIDKKYIYGIGFGIGRFEIRIEIYIGVYGLIMARIGSQPALYGVVGIDALIIIALRLSVDFKIWFVRIKFSISIGISLVISAYVEFGISDAGFGIAGYATASLRIWKFSLSASVSFAINQGALNEAKRRVFEGTSMAGDELPNPLPELPIPIIGVPQLGNSKPKWRIMQVRRGEFIYMMMMPEEDSWFANPKSKNFENETEPFELTGDEYRTILELANATLIEHSFNLEIREEENGTLVGVAQMDWNKEIKIAEKDPEEDEVEDIDKTEEANKFEFKETTLLGQLFFEPEEVQKEHRILEGILDHSEAKPELIEDWRVRAESKVEQDEDLDPGMRPDVRSPKFSKEGSLYDLAMEEAFKYDLDNCFSWKQLSIAKSRWTSDVLGREEVMEYMLGQGTPLKSVQTNDDYEKRQQLLEGAERMMGNRSALSSLMIDQFQKWINSSESLDKFELLNNSGLAYKFKVPKQGEGDFSICVKRHFVDRGFNKHEDLENEDLIDAVIDQNNEGIGFEKEDHTYLTKDILEFQDKEGIHFSWILECTLPDNSTVVMTSNESAGINPSNDLFEYLDYVHIERINLSSQIDNDIIEERIKPGYVPALLDIGAGQRKFYLVVPRFNYSDLFKKPADVGDLLSYRFTAVDIFGNRSRTTELITSRKELEAPPVPEKAKLLYAIRLSSKAVEEELLDIEITLDKGAKPPQISKVYYELWYKSIPITDGGFYGFGDDGNIATDENSNDPIILPRGMQLFKKFEDLNISFSTNEIQALQYGNVYEFHVRAVSDIGNASRLIRCENMVSISVKPGAFPDGKSQGFLERIPAPSSRSEEWLHINELDYSIDKFKYPVPDRKLAVFETPWFKQMKSKDPKEREVSVSILHEPFVDNEKIYPTGGYEIFSRDRDSTLDDTFDNYEKIASIEILPDELYKTTPINTIVYSKWRSAFNSEAKLNEPEIIQDYWLDWGQPKILESLGELNDGTLNIKEQQRRNFESVPAEIKFDPRLKEVLILLHIWCRKNDGYLMIAGGGISINSLEEVQLDYLLNKYDQERDPYGFGLLQWLGRSVDVIVLRNNEAVGAKEICEILTKTIPVIDQNIAVELLFNSDKETPMQYFRLSLLPHLTYAEMPGSKSWALEIFIGQLNKLRYQANLTGNIDVSSNQSKYEELTSKFTKYLNPHELNRVGFLTSWYNDQGNITRIPRNGQIVCQLYYKEPYARRFAYRVKRIDRYHPLFKELGIAVSSDNNSSESRSLNVRLPRVVRPEPPAIDYLGTFKNADLWSSQWLIKEHEEQPLVQSNETLRNRLGFRSVAWSLFNTTKPGWKKWSGWETKPGWYKRSLDPKDDSVPGLTDFEKKVLLAGGIWDGESNLKADDLLGGHPFTEQLKPKGLVVRIPKLPYYYSYRLAAFCRTDDLDSIARLSDPIQSDPLVLPNLDLEHTSWKLQRGNRIKIWWRIPSAWESFDTQQKKVWKQEQPFASRLWDYDLKYIIQINRNSIITPLVYIKPVMGPDSETVPSEKEYSLTTTGTDLYIKEHRKIETGNPTSQKSKYNPTLTFKFKMSEDLEKAIHRENDFAFEIKCIRNYGKERTSITQVRRKMIMV